ncbi:MAG: hypothetical protein IKT03_06075, partial [Muribaculaceae bacterium]|nr:hypothetical protein [Muribaculaceae bacterium]MBR6490086.1 hypothetical protein [Muribaculaceae bacterium]
MNNKINLLLFCFIVCTFCPQLYAQEDNLFTEAGNYYVSNKGNNKYVVIDAANYNAAASATNKDDADVVTLAFDGNGIVTTMENLYGDGDMIAILEQVKSVLRNRLNNHGLNSDFVEEMFRIKLVMTDDGDGSMYFCFDIPQIEDIDEIRDYLLNEGGINNQLVKDYLDLLLQPGKRVYLCITDKNGAFSFTQDKNLDAAKWTAEEYVILEDDLFTTSGNYIVSNNGNGKYVVIDAANYNATASVDKQDADVITIDFDDSGIVSTMVQKYGTGDMIATLTRVKDILKNKLEQNNMDASFVDDMFDIKLVKTGDSENSLYFCFDIPRINNLTAIRNYLNVAINNERVKAYLEVLLQPGKRIYLSIVDEEGTFGFTRDKAAATSKWIIEEAKHDPADYLSNTLPVLYINTVDETPILDKETYIQGSYYLDANGCGNYESIGSEEAPLALQIKGRGNSSWTHPKKP